MLNRRIFVSWERGNLGVANDDFPLLEDGSRLLGDRDSDRFTHQLTTFLAKGDNFRTYFNKTVFGTLNDVSTPSLRHASTEALDEH
jgi:hypothetical protein